MASNRRPKSVPPRAPLTSGARERRRSIPSIDPPPVGGRVALDAMALTSNRAQLDALKRVHGDLAVQRATLGQLRWLLVTLIVLVASLMVLVVVIAAVGSNRFDGVERRIERLEKPVFQTEEK